MHSPSNSAASPARRASAALARPSGAHATLAGDAGERIARVLDLLGRTLQPQRRLMRPGDVLYRCGEPFSQLHILNSGFFKLVSSSTEGREQVVGLKLRGDWLGFSAIARGSYACDAVAMDTAEVWSVRYDGLLRACRHHPELMETVYRAMSAEILRDRDVQVALSTLPADARVVTFLYHWADSLDTRGLRTDQFSLRLTRAEIGNHLGLTLETVSRVLSKLARAHLITFSGKNRRDICIPDLRPLGAFVDRRVNGDV